MKVFYTFVFSIAIFTVQCSSGGAYVKETDSIIGTELETMVLTDIHDNRISTAIFKEKETAVIIAVLPGGSHHLQKEYDVYTWRLMDTRNKSWYVPGFIYRNKFDVVKGAIFDESGGLLDQLKLSPGNYELSINRGVIEQVKKLDPV